LASRLSSGSTCLRLRLGTVTESHPLRQPSLNARSRACREG
jgi:hypothetical protein